MHASTHNDKLDCADDESRRRKWHGGIALMCEVGNLSVCSLGLKSAETHSLASIFIPGCVAVARACMRDISPLALHTDGIPVSLSALDCEMNNLSIAEAFWDEAGVTPNQ